MDKKWWNKTQVELTDLGKTILYVSALWLAAYALSMLTDEWIYESMLKILVLAWVMDKRAEKTRHKAMVKRISKDLSEVQGKREERINEQLAKINLEIQKARHDNIFKK